MDTASISHMTAESTSRVSEPVKAKFKNVEILRFFLAWAVVGFHMGIDLHKPLNEIGLSFLKPYLICGRFAVGCFFVLAFYFLVQGRSVRQSVMTFVCRKWLRLAPLAIVTSVFGYILHRCGYWRWWDWSVNIEQCLLVHEWATWTWPQHEPFVYTTWWCSAYMLVSVVYLALVQTLPKRYVPLVLGILAVIAWRLDVCVTGPSKFGMVLAFGRCSQAFFYLGMGVLVAYIVRCIEERPMLKPNSRLVTWGYTLAEVVLMGALLVRLFAAPRIAMLNLLLTTLCFSALLVLFILKRGYLSRLLENNLSSFLGRYAFAIFIVHPLVLSSACFLLLPHFRTEVAAHPWVVLGCIAGTTMLLAVAGYHFVERPILRLCAKSENTVRNTK